MRLLIVPSMIALIFLGFCDLDACDVETVGGPYFTWVQIQSGTDVFSGVRTALAGLGFENTGNMSGTIGLTAIACTFDDIYGGLLLWVSHGATDEMGNGYIAVEQYATKPGAESRIAT